MSKRFYWIKIGDNFFRQKHIKAIRKLEDGESCLIVYLKLMSCSLQNIDKIYYDNIEDSFAKEISLIIDEDEKIVERTLTFLEKVKLIKFSEDELTLLEVEKLTGSESESASRVKKHRAKKDNTNTDETKCNKNVTLEKEKEKEKDKDIEKNKSNKNLFILNKNSHKNYDFSQNQNDISEDEMLAQIKSLEENIII